MAGAALLFLQDEVDSRCGDSLANAVGFMTDDGIYIRRRNHLRSRRDYVRQQRLPPHLMQDFGVFGFQARPLARRHNRDGDTRDPMGGTLGHWHSIQYTATGSSAAVNPGPRLWAMGGFKTRRRERRG